jgi:hypothetical protein
VEFASVNRHFAIIFHKRTKIEVGINFIICPTNQQINVGEPNLLLINLIKKIYGV